MFFLKFNEEGSETPILLLCLVLISFTAVLNCSVFFKVNAKRHNENETWLELPIADAALRENDKL